MFKPQVIPHGILVAVCGHSDRKYRFRTKDLYKGSDALDQLYHYRGEACLHFTRVGMSELDFYNVYTTSGEWVTTSEI
jgi:hypothetical protein